MLKKIFFFYFIITSINAQQSPPVVVGRNYYGYAINEREICDWVAFGSKPEVSMAIERIVKRSGLKQNFYVMECPNTDNCFAATRNGERLIVYDSKFINRLSDLTKTDWGALSILAHEIGHHLQGHTIKAGGSEHDKEIEADEFSGFVMYQMGATLREAQSAIASLTSEYTTNTHPPRSKRLRAIEKGYNNAKDLYPELKKSNTSEKFPEAKMPEPRNTDYPTNTPTKVETENSSNKMKGCIEGSCTEGRGIAINGRTGERYDGNWKMGKRHGNGTEYYSDGKLKYVGEYVAGIYAGKGTLYYKNGEKYAGGFYKGKMHGENSTFYYKNGDRLVINFIEGKKEGKGRYIYYGGAEGTKFYKNDMELK